jgi:Ca-activated chloride channel family protein
MIFRFQHPWFLLLLLLAAWSLIAHLRKWRKRATLKYSDISAFKKIASPLSVRLRFILPLLRTAALVVLIVALARPQRGETEEEILTQGVDIMLAVDVSGSMAAEDFKPLNRLDAAKEVVAEFIQGRKNDRIGMVVFARKAFTKCPLTLDYGILLNFLDDVSLGMIDDGTAIGMALATCVNRLKNSEAKSKIIILLTDGVNNSGEIQPLTGAHLAKAMNVKIYTIGAGSKGTALFPYDDPVFGKRYVRLPVEIDEKTLQDIAGITGAEYFRATDKSSLRRIYQEISEMEQTEIRVKQYTKYAELFPLFLYIALGAVLLEALLGETRFRTIP